MTAEVRAPLVTVIVAVHNGERFLADALESVLAQDYEPFEVVVVDDGSLDATPAIVASFPSARYVRQDNAGPAAARNTGLRLARGEIVAFVDHDDRVPPNKLSVQVAHLLEHPDVGCVLGRQEIELEPGQPPPAWLRRDPVLDDLGGINFITAVARKRVLDQLGGFDASYRTAEDRDLLVRMRAAGIGIAVLPNVVLYRRVHADNLTNENLTRDAPHPLLRSLKATIDARKARTRVDEEGAS